MDLNAFLYVDKLFLAAMARELGETTSAGAYEAQAARLRDLIRRYIIVQYLSLSLSLSIYIYIYIYII